jgi:hypothetical protein
MRRDAILFKCNSTASEILASLFLDDDILGALGVNVDVAYLSTESNKSVV